jgi:hypothetical protein
MAASGEANGRARLTRADVTEVRRRYAAGETGVALAKEYGVVRTHMYRIISGDAWPDVPVEPRPGARLRAGSHGPKLSEADVLDIRDFSAGGFTGSSLANTYGVSLGYIYKVIHGSVWKHVKPDGHPLGS